MRDRISEDFVRKLLAEPAKNTLVESQVQSALQAQAAHFKKVRDDFTMAVWDAIDEIRDEILALDSIIHTSRKTTPTYVEEIFNTGYMSVEGDIILKRDSLNKRYTIKYSISLAGKLIVNVYHGGDLIVNGETFEFSTGKIADKIFDDLFK